MHFKCEYEHRKLDRNFRYFQIHRFWGALEIETNEAMNSILLWQYQQEFTAQTLVRTISAKRFSHSGSFPSQTIPQT